MDNSSMESRNNSEIPAETTNDLSEAVRLLSDGFSGISKFFGLQEYLKKIPEEAVRVDAAMTQLSRSTGASASELRIYFDQAAESARRYGISISDLLGVTAEWSRMGYGLPDAHALAEAAALYSHITGMDIGSSGEALASTMQGLQLEAGEVMQLLDMLAGTGHDLSIDPAGIGNALQESAASFRAADTDLSQTIALVAGADSVIADPGTVSDLWNAVETHIYGAKLELEAAGVETDGMISSTVQLRDLVQNLTGFDIMVDSAGTQLKDLYSIVVGIGSEWQNLSASEQSGLLDALAGSQGDALGSVLDNISAIETAYQSAGNASGSALAAQTEYEQRIQHSLDRLEASFQHFVNNFLGDGLLKWVADFGNGAVNILDSFTDFLGPLASFEMAGAGVGITKLVKNLDCRKVLKIA